MATPVNFVGGSYPLKRKKADTQQTINMIVCNVESGSGKARKFLKSIPGLTRFSDIPPPPPPPFDCELLLHFDEADPAAWTDHSPREHVITRTTSDGSIASEPAGEFYGAMRLTQLYPGGRSLSQYNTQAYLVAVGDIPFGSDEFFISAVVDMEGAPPAVSTAVLSFAIANSYAGTDGGIHGWNFDITTGEDGIVRLGFVMRGTGFTSGVLGIDSNDALGTVPSNGKTHLAVSRKRSATPGLDTACLFIDGVLVQRTLPFPSSSAYGGGMDGTRIGARDFSSSAGTTSLISGFQGVMDELFIIKGDGVGVDADFAVPAYPYSAAHPWPQTE